MDGEHLGKLTGLRQGEGAGAGRGAACLAGRAANRKAGVMSPVEARGRGVPWEGGEGRDLALKEAAVPLFPPCASGGGAGWSLTFTGFMFLLFFEGGIFYERRCGERRGEGLAGASGEAGPARP